MKSHGFSSPPWRSPLPPRHVPGIFAHGPRPRTSAAQKRISFVDEEDQASPDTGRARARGGKNITRTMGQSISTNNH